LGYLDGRSLLSTILRLRFLAINAYRYEEWWRTSLKRPTNRKTTKRVADKAKGISVSDPDYLTPLIEPFDGVWSGQIARLRFYASQQLVQAFLAPGNNNNLVGTTTNPTLIQALFLARDSGRVILGYTANNVIEFIDY
jgi:hypothetical protein